MIASGAELIKFLINRWVTTDLTVLFEGSCRETETVPFNVENFALIV